MARSCIPASSAAQMVKKVQTVLFLVALQHYLPFSLTYRSYVSAADVNPPSGDCWDSTTKVTFAELTNAATPNFDASTERRYVFCTNTVYNIASLNPPLSLPNATLGEMWPILVSLPNVNLFCERNCTLNMVEEPSNAIFAATTEIVSSSGLAPGAPPSLIDNLIIDGFTFQNTGGQVYKDTLGVVTLGPPGQAVVIKNCDFRNIGKGGWAIASEYYASANASTDVLYQSVTISDCSFSTSIVDTSVVISFGVDGSPPEEAWPTHNVVMTRNFFTGLTNTGEGGGGAFGGILSFAPFTQVELTENCFQNVRTPSGSVIEILGELYSLENNFAMDARILEGSGIEQACLGGILVVGENRTTNKSDCLAFDATVCALDRASSAPSDVPSVIPNPTSGGVPIGIGSPYILFMTLSLFTLLSRVLPC